MSPSMRIRRCSEALVWVKRYEIGGVGLGGWDSAVYDNVRNPQIRPPEPIWLHNSKMFPVAATVRLPLCMIDFQQSFAINTYHNLCSEMLPCEAFVASSRTG